MLHSVILIAIGIAVGQVPAIAIWAKARMTKVETQVAAQAPAIVAAVEKKL